MTNEVPDRFIWKSADEVVWSQCVTCIHALPVVTGVLAGCAAFEAIPLDILTNDADHRFPYRDDNGIRYSPKPGKHHPLDDELVE